MQQDFPETSDDDDGKSGSGDFGRPQLKPNLETLFDPSSVIVEGQVNTEEPSSAAPSFEVFGEWELHDKSLMLFHRQLKKRLMLEQLNAPSKIMKVIVALATQPSKAGQWDVEHLLKALDAATQKRFSKGLYQIASLSNDSAKLDWLNGTLKSLDSPKQHMNTH